MRTDPDGFDAVEQAASIFGKQYQEGVHLVEERVSSAAYHVGGHACECDFCTGLAVEHDADNKFCECEACEEAYAAQECEYCAEQQEECDGCALDRELGEAKHAALVRFNESAEGAEYARKFPNLSEEDRFNQFEHWSAYHEALVSHGKHALMTSEGHVESKGEK